MSGADQSMNVLYEYLAALISVYTITTPMNKEKNVSVFIFYIFPLHSIYPYPQLFFPITQSLITQIQLRTKNMQILVSARPQEDYPRNGRKKLSQHFCDRKTFLVGQIAQDRKTTLQSGEKNRIHQMTK